MKQIIPIACSLILLAVSCAEKNETIIVDTNYSTDTLAQIPDTTVLAAILNYDNKTSQWTLNDQLYSGYAVSYYQDSSLKEKIRIINGKKENQSFDWYPDGHLKEVASYHKGKLHGEKKVWSTDTNHVLISYLNYKFGKPHGEQKKWYRTGELHKVLHLNMGQEEGIQQAYRENGDLYANYEAKNGRTFGLQKASLCYGLEDENIDYDK